MRRYVVGLILGAVLCVTSRTAFALDHNHAAWDALLKRNVVVAPNANSSRVDYAAFKRESDALDRYLTELSAVTPAEYDGWTREQKLAFLVNAYNAFTIKLVLTRYPGVKSIKDIGSLLQSPWKRPFFVLLGEKRSLDDVEQRMIRAPGAFDEPRIHFALNCASIGCPMLREEAYVGAKLEAQLESAVRRFLGDRSRNRYDPVAGRLEISPIFDWYKADFEKGGPGIASVPRFLARYADFVADEAVGHAMVRRAKLPIRYLDYDWRLNDVGR
ncbi:MAG: hypothetical protein JWN94_1809 [Betaproteobacteria bacterium]|nr:hypothetical protein [Betaproteobacteria bacterium]